jgi:hypothetical protein
MVATRPSQEKRWSYANLLSPSVLLNPSKWRASLQAARTLWFDYGHLRSAATSRSVDAEGAPLPWYTYPAIEYLRQLDFHDSLVFEYGSGFSTLFWAARARQVVSVEDEEEWHGLLRAQLLPNCELHLETDLARYVDVIRRYPDGFDVVVVDGPARGHTRLKCCKAALEHLRPGGLIVLDNSDWLPESAATLRSHDLIQVDMAGFVPINAQTQTTSLFFDRQFVTRPGGARLPQPATGASGKIWEHVEPPTEPSVTLGGERFGGVTSDVPFEIAAPGGARRFRLVAGRDREEWSTIFDVDSDRVLVYMTAGEDCPALETVTTQSWDAFREFISRHPRRRYVP